ncbi:histidine--tRNA ligase [Nesterenkonia sp.]|uniref:histidine--tRNA ligase n=1 Tax=Nesterenkonia sp. TaxID=704201 RepID=UPI0026346763|nr:histidine--tRNA ligase [Nesterenkonia sp.]
MARTASLSGYLELLPEERLVELHMLDTLRRVFEAHGFSSIESRAVEPLEVLLGKGEIDKEVYAVSRIHDDDGAAAAAKHALHFDLTVPFARYVVENAGHLAFPFRRYQIQKVWRGERPQAGRFREFTQADIDIVGDGELPFRCDVEIALVMARALEALRIGEFTLRVNSRKLSEGFYRSIGLEDTAAVLRAVDKLEKIGAERVAAELVETAGASETQAEQALALARIRTSEPDVAPRVLDLLGDAAPDDLLRQGLEELTTVMAELTSRVPGRAEADLSIARGLDYYTGTVIETVLHGHEELGSVCSGGRYESLATKGRRSFPGVGLSIGLTRLLSALLDSGEVSASRKVPTAVYVTLREDQDWPAAQDVADQLRERGISAEVALSAEKFGKQIKYADRRGIPYVWFTDEQGRHEVKDIRSGQQTEADPASWSPAAVDLTPQIRFNDR